MTPEKTIRITLRKPVGVTADTHQVRVNISVYEVQYGKPVDVPLSVYHALNDAGERFEITVHDQGDRNGK